MQRGFSRMEREYESRMNQLITRLQKSGYRIDHDALFHEANSLPLIVKKFEREETDVVEATALELTERRMLETKKLRQFLESRRRTADDNLLKLTGAIERKGHAIATRLPDEHGEWTRRVLSEAEAAAATRLLKGHLNFLENRIETLRALEKRLLSIKVQSE
ncbi:hypothetical protein HY991_01280 [Candidatus Micrarchaeota archaeon]|nr:hypothetical protein [Candidatus Micrarchaeota archaeon]